MKDNPINLFTLREMIASLAIENPEHESILNTIDILIDKFGGLRTVYLEDVLLLDKIRDKEKL
jgi:hypothetical protein